MMKFDFFDIQYSAFGVHYSIPPLPANLSPSNQQFLPIFYLLPFTFRLSLPKNLPNQYWHRHC